MIPIPTNLERIAAAIEAQTAALDRNSAALDRHTGPSLTNAGYHGQRAELPPHGQENEGSIWGGWNAMPADLQDEAILAAAATGRKDDHGKTPYHLLAPEMLESVGQVLAFGADKYAPRNWELGMDWSRPFSAMMRHMWAWWRGEAVDPETGMSHLWHAGCCIMFLIAYEARQTGRDDRP